MNDRVKRTIIIVTRLLSVLGVAFLARILATHWNEIASMRWNLESGTVVIAAIFYWVVLYFIGSSAWRILVQAGGGRLSFRKSLEIVGKAQISKYLPGNVFHYVSRAGLASAVGVPVQVSAASIVAETLFAVCSATFVAAAGAALYGGGLLNVAPPFVLSYQPAWLAAFLIVMSVGLFAASRYVPAREWILNHRRYCSPAVAASVVLRLSFFYVTVGVVLNLIVVSLWGEAGRIGWFDSSWRFTAAWLLGFLMPGAPGGIGVREAVMFALFSAPLGPGPAAGLSLIVRFVTIVADTIVYGFAAFLAKTSTTNDSRERNELGIS